MTKLENALLENDFRSQVYSVADGPASKDIARATAMLILLSNRGTPEDYLDAEEYAEIADRSGIPVVLLLRAGQLPEEGDRVVKRLREVAMESREFSASRDAPLAAISSLLRAESRDAIRAPFRWMRFLRPVNRLRLQKGSRIAARAIGALATLVGLAIGLNALFGSDETPLSGKEQRLVTMLEPQIATACVADDLRPGTPDDYSDAGIVCDAAAKSFNRLRFRAFSSLDQMTSFENRLYADLGSPKGGCSGGRSGMINWVDSQGEVQGRVLCSFGEFMWSDFDSRVAAYGSVTDSFAAFRWWQRTVKFDSAGPRPAAMASLRRGLPESFHRCTPNSTMPPGATASLDCSYRQLQSLGASIIPSQEERRSFLDVRAETHGARTEKTCDRQGAIYQGWGAPPDYRPALGGLLCYTTDGSRWIEWTHESRRLYAYASRMKNDASELFRIWQRKLVNLDEL